VPPNRGRWPPRRAPNPGLGVGTFFFPRSVLWRFCAFLNKFQQGEFKNTIKIVLGKDLKLFGGSPWQKLLAEKVEKKIISSFPVDFFYRVFGRFSA
jgi:hypothetical protein